MLYDDDDSSPGTDHHEAHRLQLETLVRLKEQCVKHARAEEAQLVNSQAQLKKQKRLLLTETEQECRLEAELSGQRHRLAAEVSEIERLEGEREQVPSGPQPPFSWPAPMITLSCRGDLQNRLCRQKLLDKSAIQTDLGTELSEVLADLQQLDRDANAEKLAQNKLFEELNAGDIAKYKQLKSMADALEAANSETEREISTLRAKHQKSSADEKQKAVASIRQIDASIETCQTELRSLDEDRRQQQLQNGRSGSPLELEQQVTQLKHNCQLLDQEIRAREQTLTRLSDMLKWIQ